MELREISVEDLTFGMYVSKLDRPWIETPFMFQGFVLKSDKQIDALKKHCKRVFIDPEKEEPPELAKVTAEDIAKVRGTTVYKETASVEVELPRAQKTYASTTVVVKELSRAVEIGNSIDSTRSNEAAAQIAINSVMSWLEAHPHRFSQVVFNVFLDRDLIIYQNEINRRNNYVI